MYGEDPRDFGMGPQWEDDPRDARTKSDEEDAYDTNRPQMALFTESSIEE